MQKTLFLITFILLGIGAYFYFSSPAPIPTAPTQSPSQPVAEVSQSGVLVLASHKTTTTLNDYVEKLQNTYRLKPDRRFLKAIANIQALLMADSTSNVEIVYTHQRWHVSYQGSLVGQLPESPDFQEFLDFLVNWVQQLVESNDLHFTDSPLPVEAREDLDAQLNQFFAPHAAKAANRLNQLWIAGNRTTSLFPYATRALTLLVLQQRDELGIAEHLSTQAIALLALTKALTKRSLPQEEALLAYLFGYSAHAQKIALSLPSEHAVRRYVYNEGDLLKSIAESPNSDRQAKYLYLLWLATQRDYEGWKDWLKQQFKNAESLPLFKTAVMLNEFGMNRQIASTLPYATVISLADETRQLQKSVDVVTLLESNIEKLKAVFMGLFVEFKVSIVVDFLEAELKLLKPQYAGPFLSGETYAAYFRGYFYSGLYRLGLHYLDALSSESETTEYAQLLGHSTQPIATDFRRWYQHLADSKADKGNPQRLLKDLSELKQLGASPLLRTLEEQQTLLSYGSPAQLQGIRAIIPYLDTRSKHQARLSVLARSSLHDLPLTEKLYDNVVKLDPARFQYLQAWRGYFQRDDEILMALLAKPDLELSVRLTVIKYLKYFDKISNTQLESEYQIAWGQDPNNWSVTKQYVDFLIKNQQFSKARDIASAWLTENHDHPSLKPVIMKTKIAKSYLKAGQLQEAWKKIRPLLSTYQAGAMYVGIDVLEAMGKIEKAEQVARAVYNRYPDNLDSRLKLTAFYWRQGEYQKAAEVLAQGRAISNLEDWRAEIGKNFVQSFTEQPDEIALQAYNYLLEKQIKPENLQEIAIAVAHTQRLELAEKMLQPLKLPGFGQMLLYVRRYGYRKAFEDQERALAWLDTKIPHSMRLPLSMIAYNESQYELLWEFIGQLPQNPHGEFVWLMRVSAFINTDHPDNRHDEQLRHHYEQYASGHYNTIARYLLGMANEDEVLALITNPKTECEVAYYIGLKAQSEGRYLDASNWYRIAVETGLIQNGEYRWAHAQLTRWYNEEKSL